MADLPDFDSVVKTVGKYVDDWSASIKDVAKKLADIQEEIDKLEALKKQREAAAKDAEKVSKELSDKIFSMKISPKADPKPFDALPDLVKKMITKGGIPLGDTGLSLAPSNWKFDPPPKFKVVSGGLVIKGTF